MSETTNAPRFGNDVHQPLRLEAEQGIADGEPADPEPFGELFLAEGLAGVEGAVEDLVAEGIGDEVGGGGGSAERIDW